jgi:arabinose-5-phosphate isomerase
VPGAVESARRVILAEAEALRLLAGRVGADFAAAVDRLGAIEGRVVVTGMGKSGHVARKIASTLASTGTPALFVHPGEASHGDLGMITAGDAVLALSNSGETTELRDLILYTRRFGIPLVAIVGRQPSTLAEAADHCLRLPEVREACPMGLAPTTSTTCMLALGDALAVALLERRGFSAHDFALFHPGGKLGSQLLRVEQLMRRGDELPLVAADCRMSEAVLEMTDKRLGCVGVLGEDGRLTGIVTDGDLRRHMRPDLLERTAGELMTPHPRTIERRALAVEALAAMNGGDRPVTVLFVAEDGGRPVGALHLHDCLKAGIA